MFEITLFTISVKACDRIRKVFTSSYSQGDIVVGIRMSVVTCSVVERAVKIKASADGVLHITIPLQGVKINIITTDLIRLFS